MCDDMKALRETEELTTTHAERVAKPQRKNAAGSQERRQRDPKVPRHAADAGRAGTRSDEKATGGKRRLRHQRWPQWILRRPGMRRRPEARSRSSRPQTTTHTEGKTPSRLAHDDAG
jgi:hypothetical protein